MGTDRHPTLLFLYGPIASGKLTVARIVAERSGWPLFHNHLIVDAVAALFPFGSPQFVDLRERFWIEAMTSAIRMGRSLIFTFAPEPSVSADFPARLAREVEALGGVVHFVALTISPDIEDERVANADRGAFGKLRSTALLRDIRPGCDTYMEAMPSPSLSLDTGQLSPDEAAQQILMQL